MAVSQITPIQVTFFMNVWVWFGRNYWSSTERRELYNKQSCFTINSIEILSKWWAVAPGLLMLVGLPAHWSFEAPSSFKFSGRYKAGVKFISLFDQNFIIKHGVKTQTVHSQLCQHGEHEQQKWRPFCLVKFMTTATWAKIWLVWWQSLLISVGWSIINTSWNILFSFMIWCVFCPKIASTIGGGDSRCGRLRLILSGSGFLAKICCVSNFQCRRAA